METSDLKKEEYIWDTKLEKLLDKMRINCVNFSEYHIYKYRLYKRYLMCFRIPIIFLSGANVFFALGLQSYISQGEISIINGILSLVCGMLTSIELFLNIQKKMENDLISHKDFYRLSIDIFKVISLDKSVRKVDGKTFLDQKFSEYEKLIEFSNVIDSEFVFDTLSCDYPIINNKKINKTEYEKICNDNDSAGIQVSSYCCNTNYLVKKNNLTFKRFQTLKKFYEEYKLSDEEENKNKKPDIELGIDLSI